MYTNARSGDPIIDGLNNESAIISKCLDSINYDSLLLEECELIIKGLDCLKKASEYFQSVLESQEKRSEGE